MQFMHESADLNCKAFAVSPVDLIHLLTLISAFICFTVSQWLRRLKKKKKLQANAVFLGYFLIHYFL